MGHVQPDGAVAEPLIGTPGPGFPSDASPGSTASATTQARAPHARLDTRRRRVDPLQDTPLWALWRSLTASYPLWRSVLSAMSPWSAFRKENSYFWFDVVEGLRSMPSSLRVVQRLGSVTDGELDGVIGLAEVNSRRQEHFFRTLVLAYVTVPFTIGAIWAQLMPGQLMGLLKNPELAPVWGGTIAGLASALLIRFVADWRARSFLTLLQMARIERQTGSADGSTAAPPVASPTRSSPAAPGTVPA